MSATRERETKVLQLRRAGATFEAIAKDVGYSTASAAYKAFQRAAARGEAESLTEAQQLELDRLDRLYQAVYPKAAGGNLEAVGMALRISERRSKLRGLDAAKTIQTTSAPPGSEDPVDELERKRQERIAEA